jgi:uncharacterized protein YceH (UPF0502 family)
MRNLTNAQIGRRAFLVRHLTIWGAQTADALRSHLAHRWHTFVTVDTVQRDLKAMEKAGTVKQRGHTGGRSNRVLWTAVFEEGRA